MDLKCGGFEEAINRERALQGIPNSCRFSWLRFIGKPDFEIVERPVSECRQWKEYGVHVCARTCTRIYTVSQKFSNSELSAANRTYDSTNYTGDMQLRGQFARIQILGCTGSDLIRFLLKVSLLKQPSS